MKSHRISKKSQGERLDVFMMNFLSDFTRSKIQFLIKENKILVNGKSVKPSYILKGTESIDYNLKKTSLDLSVDDRIMPEPIELDILFEDKDLIVINKKSWISCSSWSRQLFWNSSKWSN